MKDRLRLEFDEAFVFGIFKKLDLGDVILKSIHIPSILIDARKFCFSDTFFPEQSFTVLNPSLSLLRLSISCPNACISNLYPRISGTKLLLALIICVVLLYGVSTHVNHVLGFQKDLSLHLKNMVLIPNYHQFLNRSCRANHQLQKS